MVSMKDGKPYEEPFSVYAKYPNLKYNTDPRYQVVLDGVRENLYTGLQIGYDPGAPLYWFGCLGLLIGTFYALLVTHRKFHLRYENGEVLFAGTIHRLPSGFERQVAKWADDFKKLDKESESGA